MDVLSTSIRPPWIISNGPPEDVQWTCDLDVGSTSIFGLIRTWYDEPIRSFYCITQSSTLSGKRARYLVEMDRMMAADTSELTELISSSAEVNTQLEG